jgi:hypothetical protein
MIVLVATLLAVIGVALGGCWLVGYFRGPAESEESIWADRHGLLLTASSRPWVAAYLRTGRNLRQIGGFGGLIVAASIAAATGLNLHVSGLVWILVGYLVGCVWAELALTRAPSGAQRVASLTTRRLGDYVPRRIRIAQGVLPALAVLLGGICVLALRQSRLDSLRLVTLAGASGSGLVPASPHSTDQLLKSGALAAAVIAPLIMIVVWAAQRYLISRPQPSLDVGLVAADDALRASSAHLLGASGLAAVSLLIGSQFGYLISITYGFWHAMSSIGALVAFVGALLIFRYWRNAPWRVRRHPVESGPTGTGVVPEPTVTWSIRRSPVPMAVGILVLVALAGWGLRTWGLVNPGVTVYANFSDPIPVTSTRWEVTLSVFNEARAPITIDRVTATTMAVSLNPEVVGVVAQPPSATSDLHPPIPASTELPLAVAGGSTATLTVALLTPWCHEDRAVIPFNLAVSYRSQSGRTVTKTAPVTGLDQLGDCLDPLPTGVPPVDPVAADAAVRQSFLTVYDPTATATDRIGLIDDPAGIQDASDQALAGPFGLFARAEQATIDEVSFDRPDHAWVRYELSVAEGSRLAQLTLIDGHWKVARGTVCADLALAGALCGPVPN